MILALRFLLEIAILVSIAYGGFHVGSSYLTKILFGIGALAITMIIWNLFGSPNAPYALQGFNRLLLELAILGVAITFVWNLLYPIVIIIFAIVFILNSFSLFIFDGNSVKM